MRSPEKGPRSPEGRPEPCPQCKGSGKVKDPKTNEEKECRYCNGSGWVRRP